MKKGRIVSILVLLSALLLSGCAVRTVEELYSLPKRSREFQSLQASIDIAMAGLEYSAPTSGENQQTVQIADLNGDGTNEYLVFAKGTSEKPMQILIFREDAYGKLYVHLDGRAQHCKGGRSRDVVILDCNQQRMREILKGFVPGKLMFPKVPSHLNVHAIRAFYAMDYYDAIARPIEEIPLGERVPLKHPKTDKRRPNQVRDTAPAIYQRRSDGRQFDRKSLLIVTESLGHDRESVIVQNYYR